MSSREHRKFSRQSSTRRRQDRTNCRKMRPRRQSLEQDQVVFRNGSNCRPRDCWLKRRSRSSPVARAPERHRQQCEDGGKSAESGQEQAHRARGFSICLLCQRMLLSCVKDRVLFRPGRPFQLRPASGADARADAIRRRERRFSNGGSASGPSPACRDTGSGSSSLYRRMTSRGHSPWTSRSGRAGLSLRHAQPSLDAMSNKH